MPVVSRRQTAGVARMRSSPPYPLQWLNQDITQDLLSDVLPTASDLALAERVHFAPVRRVSSGIHGAMSLRSAMSSSAPDPGRLNRTAAGWLARSRPEDRRRHRHPLDRHLLVWHH